ncbi:Cytochrome p450 [Apiospora kogelbergensis]|uniref:Cytochrome p450 n=1 Tax=Apiospora kogelbergensis TaxID=1337665 RepID=A0AAW0QY06_9PEZI
MDEYNHYYSSPVVLRMFFGGAIASLIYLLGLAVYRLYFSPIAGFPGPKLAALTLWYELYYDVMCGGQYWVKIAELHEQYGPIIRINPYELHVRDPDFHDVLYSGPGQRRDKWAWSAGMFGNSTSGFGTVPHDLHRMRRAALSPFFGKQAIARHMEPAIRELLHGKLCARFERLRATGEPLDVLWAYAALTTDIITLYAFRRSYGCLDAPDWLHEWPVAMVEGTKACHVNKQFAWLHPLMRATPEWIVKIVNPAVMHIINLQRDLERQIAALMQEEEKTEGKKSKTQTDGQQQPTTIFHNLIHGDLPPEEKTLPRLVDEGQTMIAAGQETTSFFLKTVTYYILADPAIHARLRAELRQVDVATASVAQLERLPYLRAVVQEGHRFAHGVVGRLQRVAPDAALRCGAWAIPAGTPVSMTAPLLHRDPALFPDPDRFDPARWLFGGRSSSARGEEEAAEEDARRREVMALERFLVPFGKGTRQCLGINLATAEIYLTLAAVFGSEGRFEMELYETTERDVEVVHDYFIPHGHADSKGVRVVFK